MTNNKELCDIYYDPAKGFAGIKSVISQAPTHIKPVTVKKWLETQPTYSMHKPARRNYPRNRVIVNFIDEQWQADLVDLQALHKYNDGYKYLLTCIDIFSKFSWAIPLKSKVSANIIEAFKSIFNQGRRPYKLQTDAGTEFVNKKVQKFLKNEDVEFFITNSEKKASVVERFNRTLKERMWKIFTKRNTYSYLDFLPELLSNYNHSFHRTIGMKPSDVDKSKEETIRNRAFKTYVISKPVFKFIIGDKVRLNKTKRHFEKGYWPNWTEEYFIIQQRIPRQPVVYKLKDQMGEIIDGVFYEPELQKIESSATDLHIVEKVLKTRKRDGKTEYFVKWRGYPEKFNSWVANIVKL